MQGHVVRESVTMAAGSYFCMLNNQGFSQRYLQPSMFDKRHPGWNA